MAKAIYEDDMDELQRRMNAHNDAASERFTTLLHDACEDVKRRQQASEEISYFYRPLAFYEGAVLKCAGIATDENRARMMKEPGTIELKGYRGDRIDAVTHQKFTG